jgi:hypothetical protein
MQPWTRCTVLNELEGLVNRVIRTDEEVGAGASELFRRGHHEFSDSRPVILVDKLDVFSEGVRVHRDFRVFMGSHEFGAFETDRAIAEGGSFRAAGDDADVLWQDSSQFSVLSSQFSVLSSQFSVLSKLDANLKIQID